MENAKPKTLGIFALAMINVAAVLSLRNYPSMADRHCLPGAAAAGVHPFEETGLETG